MRKDLKELRLAQRSNQEAKSIDIIKSENCSNEKKKTNGTKETCSFSRNAKVTPSFPSSDDSVEEKQ